MPHSIDHVEIALSLWVMERPWASREALLEELRVQPSLAEIVKEFQAVGTSRPVQLTQPQKGLLVEAIETWASQVEGGLKSGLPSGIAELHRALSDDLHDRPNRG